LSIPTKIREDIKTQLWDHADNLDWASLSAKDKSRYYTVWTETAEIGGRLGAFMDPRQVRVYIKDTLLKSYARERSSDPSRVMRILKIDEATKSLESYIKPHGLLLSDKRQIAWSRATEWKATLMTLHERAHETKATPYGGVLFQANARFADEESRAVVISAAKKLGISQLIWVD
jgi:hypothetical protein